MLSCQRASENRIRKILGQTSEEKEKRKFSVKRSKENKRKKEFSIKRRNKAKEKEIEGEKQKEKEEKEKENFEKNKEEQKKVRVKKQHSFTTYATLLQVFKRPKGAQIVEVM